MSNAPRPAPAPANAGRNNPDKYSNAGTTPDPWEACAALEYGADRSFAWSVREQVINTPPEGRARIEDRLLKALGLPTCTAAGRAFLCQMLALVGSGKSVPILAALLKQAKQQLDDAVPTLGRGGAEPVHVERLGHDVLDPQPGAERGVRVLENDLHVPAQLAHRGAAQAEQVRPVERNVARGWLGQAQQHASGGRFAAARFAHQRQRLARRHVERHAVHRLDVADGAEPQRAARDREMLAQTTRQQERLGRAAAILAIVARDQRVHQAFTSMAARRPSLMRLKQIEVMKIITPGSAASSGLT